MPMNAGFVLLRHLKPPSLPTSSLPLPHPAHYDLSQNSGFLGGGVGGGQGVTLMQILLRG